MRRFGVLVIGSVVSLGLVGYGDDGSQRYDTLTQLRDAAVAAGRDASVEAPKDLLPSSDGLFAALVGKNWMVNSPQASDLRDEMGVEVVSLD